MADLRNSHQPTWGQVQLALDEAERLRFELALAAPQPEDGEYRRDHIANSRAHLRRIAELLGTYVGEAEHA